MPNSPQTPDSSHLRLSSNDPLIKLDVLTGECGYGSKCLPPKGNRSTTRLPNIPGARPNALPRDMSHGLGTPLQMRSSSPWTTKPHVKEGAASWLNEKNAASHRIQAKFSGSAMDASAAKSRPQPFAMDGATDWMTDRFIKAEKGIGRILRNNAASELKADLSSGHVTVFPEEVVQFRDLAANRVVNELRDRLSPARYSVPGREMPMEMVNNKEAEKTQGKKKKRKDRK